MGLTVRRNPIFYNMSQSHSVISSTIVDVLRHAVGGEESRRRKRADHVTWVRYGHRLYVRSVSEHILFWRPCGTDLPRMGKKYVLKPTFEETKPLFLNLLLTLSDLWHYVTMKVTWKWTKNMLSCWSKFKRFNFDSHFFRGSSPYCMIAALF